MSKRKVVFITNSFQGLHLFRRELIEVISKENECILVGPNDKDFTLFDDIEAIIKHVSLVPHSINPFQELKTLRQLYKLIKNQQPDIVLTYTIKPNLYAGILSRIKPFTFIPNITGLGKLRVKQNFFGFLITVVYRFSLKKASTVFFQNQSNFDIFKEKKIVSDNAILLPGSGVNLSRFQMKPYPESKMIHFLFAGRVIKEKGIDYYLKLAEVYAHEDNVHFHVVGALHADYANQIESLNDAGIVKYHGHISDIRPLYEMCHCLIHPTYYAEGMSNVLLEASATGRPMIATKKPGSAETFVEGVSGFGFEPKNYAQLKTIVNHFIHLSHEDKKRMGKAAREHVENHFDRQQVVHAYQLAINKKR